MFRRLFRRLNVRFASWFINSNLNEYSTREDVSFMEFCTGMYYNFQKVTISVYSYAFYVDYGVYVYSRCNGRIYFFD